MSLENCSTRNAERNASGWREMIPEGNPDLLKWSNRYGKYLDKYKMYPFKFLKIYDMCTPMFTEDYLQYLRHGSNLNVHWQMNG